MDLSFSMRDLVPWPNPGLLRWVRWVLATGPSGKSLFFVFNVTLLWCQTPLPPFNLTADHRELSWVRPSAPGEGPGEACKAAMRLIPCPRQGHKQAQPDQERPTDSGLHTCVLLQNTNFGVVSFKAIVDITERKGNSSVQSLSRVRLFATPWTAAHQTSLSITNSRSPPKPMSIESVMPSNHLILCCPLLLLPSIFPSIRVFSNEPALRIRWPKYWSFSFNISPSSEHSILISFSFKAIANITKRKGRKFPYKYYS